MAGSSSRAGGFSLAQPFGDVGSRRSSPRQGAYSLPEKLARLNWFMVLGLIAITAMGIATLYSVAGGSFEPWAKTQLIRFVFALFLMLMVALIDLKYWMGLAYPLYFIGLALLIAVEFVGLTGKGGQRWLDLGVMRLQPSELMKIAVVMALARFYHGLNVADAKKLVNLVVPFMIIALPVLLVLRQPDLGTSLMIIASGIVVIFMAGAPMWLFVIGGMGILAAIPVAWELMHDYQRQRVLTFLDPEKDPLGAGYQILQSKIALGSGGVTGKGFLQGTQSHLNFLPEMKTDFIFTVLAEEFGLVGGLTLLFLYVLVLGYAVAVSHDCRHHFGRLLAAGLSFALFLYVFINIGMVMGLLPVVGVPLPLVSYGGSVMLTMMLAYGLILSTAINRNISLPKKLHGVA